VQASDRAGNIFLEIKALNLDDGKNYTLIRVTDEGCGIDEKDLKNVIDLSVPENSHFEIQLPLSKQKLKEFENQVIASKTNKNGKKKIIH